MDMDTIWFIVYITTKLFIYNNMNFVIVQYLNQSMLIFFNLDNC